MKLDLDDYIYKELSNNAELTAEINDRLEKYFGELDILKPYITFSLLSASNYKSKFSENVQHYSFLIVGDNLKIVKKIKSILFETLENFGGELGDYPTGAGATVIRAILIGETSNHIQEQNIYRLAKDYQFHYCRK
jgi:hypothetical protein